MPPIDSLQREMLTPQPTEGRRRAVASLLLLMQADPHGLRMGPIAFPADMPDWVPEVLQAIRVGPLRLQDDVRCYRDATMNTVYMPAQVDSVAHALVDKYTDPIQNASMRYNVADSNLKMLSECIDDTEDDLRSLALAHKEASQKLETAQAQWDALLGRA